MQTELAKGLMRESNPPATATTQEAIDLAALRPLSPAVEAWNENYMGLSSSTAPETLAGLQGPNGPLSRAEYVAARKAARADARGGHLPTDIGTWSEWEGHLKPLPEGTYVPDTGLTPPRSTTGSLQMKEALGNEQATGLLDKLRGRSAAQREGLLPIGERRELRRLRKGLPSGKAMDIREGRAPGLAEQQIGMQRQGYRDRAFGEGVAGMGAEATPTAIESFRQGLYGNQASTVVPSIDPVTARQHLALAPDITKDEYIHQSVTSGLGTREEAEETWQEVHPSLPQRLGMPSDEEWLENIITLSRPPTGRPAGFTPEQIARLRRLAAEGNDRAAQILADDERRRTGLRRPRTTIDLPGTPG
jgi:hypothetical protein